MAIDQLAWGITGVPPVRLASQVLPSTTGISRALAAPASLAIEKTESKRLDALAISVIKRKLHIFSEIIAHDAATSAAMAAKTYPHDVLTVLVPFLVELRWNRGYQAALKRILKVPEANKKLGDFRCVEAEPPCEADSGMLSARRDGADQVTILLQGVPACVVSGLTEQGSAAVADSIDRYGRLGVASRGGLTVLDRVKAIEVSTEQRKEVDELAEMLCRQHDVLIPLLARYGIPGGKQLIPQEEAYPGRESVMEDQLPPATGTHLSTPNSLALKTLPIEEQGIEEIAATKAWSGFPWESSFDRETITQLMNLLRRDAQN